MNPTTPTQLIGLDILGQHWDIVWSPPTLIPDKFGHSDAENQEIVLRANLRGQQALDTLLHELTHAISSITGIEITEAQTHTIGFAMAMILRDNRELLPWMQERFEEEDARDYQRITRANRKNTRTK